MKRLWCWLFGHKPYGLIKKNKFDAIRQGGVSLDSSDNIFVFDSEICLRCGRELWTRR